MRGSAERRLLSSAIALTTAVGIGIVTTTPREMVDSPTVRCTEYTIFTPDIPIDEQSNAFHGTGPQFIRFTDERRNRVGSVVVSPFLPVPPNRVADGLRVSRVNRGPSFTKDEPERFRGPASRLEPEPDPDATVTRVVYESNNRVNTHLVRLTLKGDRVSAGCITYITY